MSVEAGLFGNNSSVFLIPNTNNYMFGKKIIKLPCNIAEMSEKAKKLFVEALKMSNESRTFVILKGPELEQEIQRKFHEAEKLIPKGHYTEKIFFIIKATGMIFLAVLTAKYARL